MEGMGSFPSDMGQCGLLKEPLADHVMVIDLEEEEELSREELVARADEKEELGATAENPISWSQMDDDSSFWQAVTASEPTSQHVDVVDLLSSESSDDDDMVEEEPEEEIITNFSSEEAALLAEVMKAIKGGGDLKRFRVESLKTYLRHHRLRLVGLKAVLLDRIQEHLKIKDGRAEEMYPRSSFNIDCTGDVCLGDTVLFRQTVYDLPFDIEKRRASGPPLGRRWVAGKVVNESYGAEKQQHTFTIEVLWSTGTKPFPVMRPVKIKGRNLYRIQTLRQLWPNETERQKALDEKHARGAEARAIRRATKSRGRRQDARVHPYQRTHPTELSRVPPTVRAQAHLQNVHQGSVSASHTASMRHPINTEPAVSHSRHAAPEPTVPLRRRFHKHRDGLLSNPQPSSQSQQNYFTDRHSRGRDFHSQQSRHDHVQNSTYTEPAASPSRYPAPEPTGRSYHSHHEGLLSDPQPSFQSHRHPQGRNFLTDHGSFTIHVENSMRQHGRVHPQRQVFQRGMASQNSGAIPCFNAACDKFGAKQCISRSCASCCGRNGGGCPRHR